MAWPLPPDSVHGRGMRVVVTRGTDGNYAALGFMSSSLVVLADQLRSAGTALFARLQIHRPDADEPEETSLGEVLRNAVRVRRLDDGSYITAHKYQPLMGEDLAELAERLKGHSVEPEAYVVITDERGRFLREAKLEQLLPEQIHHIASADDASTVLHIAKVPRWLNSRRGANHLRTPSRADLAQCQAA